MKRVSNFSAPRQDEAHRRFYAGQNKYTIKTTAPSAAEKQTKECKQEA